MLISGLPLLSKGETPANPEVQTEVFVEPALIHIGDIIHYHLIIRCDKEVKVELPDISNNLGGFSVKEFSPRLEKLEKGQKVISQTFDLNTFVTGDYIIPPAILHYGRDKCDQSVTTAAVYARVDSLLNRQETDIRDIAFPLSGKRGQKWLIWTLWIFLPLLGISLIAYLVYFLRKRREKLMEEALPPWDAALEELEELIHSGILEQDIKEYYYSLSDILRRYIEKRYGLMAPERTTEEFIQLMQTQGQFNREHRQLLQKFLLECDLVKFAKITPDKTETGKGTEMVRRFVDETRINEPETQEGSPS